MILLHFGNTIVIIDIVISKNEGRKTMTSIKDAKLQANLGLQKAMGVKPVAMPKPLTQTTVQQPTSTGVAPTQAVEQKKPVVVSAATNVLSPAELETKALAVAQTLSTISGEMKTLFLEREVVIENMFLALIAGHHILLLGPPGTGKLLAI